MPGSLGRPIVGVEVRRAAGRVAIWKLRPAWPGSLTIPALWPPLVSRKVSSVSATRLSL